MSRGTKDQIANHWIIEKAKGFQKSIEKAKRFQKNNYFCFIEYTKAFV